MVTRKARIASQPMAPGVALLGGTPLPQTGRAEVMVAMPGSAARNDAPVTPIARASSPLAAGLSTPELAWMGAHLRSGVPFRNTDTLAPFTTQNALSLSAAVMVSERARTAD